MACDIPTIPGVPVPPHIARGLQNYVAQMVGRTKPLFPGSQPVSFTRTDSLPQLLNSNYLVCEKSDGVRVLVLMIVSDQERQPLTYFITRKNEYYQAPAGVCFPVPNNFTQFHHQTLIDAELVVDTVGEQKILTLLGFDALVVNGTNCMERNLEKRLGYLNEHVLAPYRRWYRQQNQQPPLNVCSKIFERSYGLDKLYRETIPTLQHQSDGVIFTSVQAPYQIGTCPYIIKWKPSNENSVDFKLRVANGGTLHLLVWQGGNQYSEFGTLGVNEQDIQTMLREANVGSTDQLDGLIVEALYDPQYMPPAQWRFMRFRDDKPHGNHASVVEKIMTSISDNMELEELLSFMDRIRTAWKQRNP